MTVVYEIDEDQLRGLLSWRKTIKESVDTMATVIAKEAYRVVTKHIKDSAVARCD
jgi:hypothetical protein